MSKTLNLFTAVFLAATLTACASNPMGMRGDHGVVVKKSPYSANETLSRLEKAIESKGIKLIERVSHQKNAQNAGMQLRPTELLVFGNPKLGTKLFQANQRAGLDLPMKVLAWEDAEGQTWVAYNKPEWIADRHGIDSKHEVVQKMSKALNGLTDKAIGAK